MRRLVIFVSGLLLSSVLSAAEPSAGSGTVAETIDVGNYVYVRLEEDGSWLATSPVQVKPGDKIEYSGGYLMKDFYSAKLDRSFPDIFFISQMDIVSAQNAHDGVDLSKGMSIPIGAKANEPLEGEIPPLKHGLTITEILSDSDRLQGKQVSLRARVTKVSNNILGKNWITLQDGTGMAPENKLIATTTQSAPIGDTVVVSGTVKMNVDIGAGYTYKVVLEQASLDR